MNVYKQEYDLDRKPCKILTSIMSAEGDKEKVPPRSEDADGSNTSVHVITPKERLEMKQKDTPVPVNVNTDAGPETTKNEHAKDVPSASPTSIQQTLERNRIIKNLKEIGSKKPSDLNKKELKVIKFFVSTIASI